MPVRIAQLPAYARNVVDRLRASRAPRSRKGTTYRLCYFVCESYFKYLYCSLHSLSQLRTAHSLEVLVYCDRDLMLTDNQVRLLSGLQLDVRVVPWTKSQGWGTEQIESIWRAYAHAAEGAAPGTYLARVDADVFFFSDWLFDYVASSGADFVGDGHYVNFEYCQGGIYFIAAESVGAILAIAPLESFEAKLAQANIRVEDKAASHFAAMAGLRTRMIYFMMFPDEYRIAGRLTSYQRWKFACLHYAVRGKAPMLDIYMAEIAPPADKPSLLAVFASNGV